MTEFRQTWTKTTTATATTTTTMATSNETHSIELDPSHGSCINQIRKASYTSNEKQHEFLWKSWVSDDQRRWHMEQVLKALDYDIMALHVGEWATRHASC
eukprot:gnl/MRDRNA2_/MRDRNA2_479458_c0_seq1.p1 gnl/MRDRNA2_/MRDRNA2_479458_c0~~gnl/MRDRNA2_/MRDRNA2_479458_c0_seq1.p1  ORF type:complete len:100 (+),score=16.61 gnl/MRDRNA2_/MRDRNA2_479458_c0_seq1:2-301(+)